jgi:hypothetical protein
MNARIITCCSLLALAMLLAPDDAHACGCCGGWSARIPLGWSESGSSVLVAHDTQVLCLTSSALEVWSRWDDEPITCFDRQDDPDRPVACDAVQALDHPTIRSSRRGAFYPREARVLPRSIVRVTSRGQGVSRAVRIDVRAGDAWLAVWSGDVLFSDDYEAPLPILVDIWPSPAAPKALLRIQGALDPTREGHESPFLHTRLVWIDLPREVGALARPVAAIDLRRSPLYEDRRTRPASR